MNRSEILTLASDITVINDGQFRYPVLTADMTAWVAANGPITADNYEDFCATVDCLGEKAVGTPGSAAMIELCADLLDAGADSAVLG